MISVKLRNLRRQDKEAVIAMLRDPQVMRFLGPRRALAEDEALKKLDGTDHCDNRRACRPFSSNAGFTVAEASVWIVLMDDELAMQQGAQIMGSVGDVFVNADGYKKRPE